MGVRNEVGMFGWVGLAKGESVRALPRAKRARSNIPPPLPYRASRVKVTLRAPKVR